MFSKGNVVLISFFAMIAGGFWWLSAKEETRIARLAATEARLSGVSANLNWQRRIVERLSTQLSQISDRHRELAEAEEDVLELKAVIEEYEEAARDDSPLKWGEGAMVDLEEYILPPGEADALLEKFDDEDSDQNFREALLARENGLVFRRRFAAVILPEPRHFPERRGGGQEAKLDEPRSLTRIENTHPGIMKGSGYIGNEGAEVFKSEIERLYVHTQLIARQSMSAIDLALNQGGGLILASWSIYREAEISRDLPLAYQVGFETRVSVVPDQFQFVGSSDFRIRTPRGGRMTSTNGVLIIFARVSLTNKERAGK